MICSSATSTGARCDLHILRYGAGKALYRTPAHLDAKESVLIANTASTGSAIHQPSWSLQTPSHPISMLPKPRSQTGATVSNPVTQPARSTDRKCARSHLYYHKKQQI